MKASEIDGILTLEQLEQMDGQRVLIPETNLYDGGFGTVVVWARRVMDGNGFIWPFIDYGQWIAIKDPYGVVEVTAERSEAENVPNNNRR